MITVWGEGRGFRVVWLLEEMGIPYRIRQVDLLAGVENDPEFLAINPGGFIPAIQDGDVTMVESIAIMEYLIARYGQIKSGVPLAPAPHDPASRCISNSCISAKRALAPTFRSSSSAALSRPRASATTGARAGRWISSTAG